MSCPLCTIPQHETPLYIDDDVYMIPTKNMKGHNIRVMICTRKHKINFSFVERTRAYGILINYMQSIIPPNESWYIVEGKYASHPDHAHLLACDSHGTEEELLQLLKTPKVEFPLQFSISNSKNAKVLVGIPAFNEEKTISFVVQTAKQYGDVMIIDDGSIDNTLRKAVNAGAKYLRHETKQGYGSALKKIFDYAKLNNYDVLITLDADGQHNPDEIPAFLKALENRADVVIGNRFMKFESGISISKQGINLVNIPRYREKAIKILSKIQGVGDAQCGFRAYSRKAIETINIKERGMGASLEILSQAKTNKLKIIEIPCTVHYNETTTHSQHPLTHGGKLLESLLWRRIWSNPFRYLGILGMLSFLLGIISTFQVMKIYIQVRVFVFSWTILSLGGLFAGALLLMTSTIIYLLRRGLEESK